MVLGRATCRGQTPTLRALVATLKDTEPTTKAPAVTRVLLLKVKGREDSLRALEEVSSTAHGLQLKL